PRYPTPPSAHPPPHLGAPPTRPPNTHPPPRLDPSGPLELECLGTELARVQRQSSCNGPLGPSSPHRSFRESCRPPCQRATGQSTHCGPGTTGPKKSVSRLTATHNTIPSYLCEWS